MSYGVSVTRTVAPASEPVTLIEAKNWLRVDFEDDNSWINTAIEAARRDAESITRAQFINATWQEVYTRFHHEMLLSVGPVSAVTSITYVDTNGATQPLSPSIYQTDLPRGRIREAYNQTWPSVRDTIYSPVTVTYICGYGTTGASVPAPIRQAILNHISYQYEHRDDQEGWDTFLHAFRSALNPYVWRVLV